MNDKLVSFMSNENYFITGSAAVVEAVPATFKKAPVVSLIRKHLQGSYGIGGIKQFIIYFRVNSAARQRSWDEGSFPSCL